jgi:integrase
MPAKLSQSIAESLAPRPKTYITYDASIHGFGVRVTPAGARSWVFDYRPRGDRGSRGSTMRRLTLGRIEALPYSRARKIAAEHYHRVRLGEDPAGAREASQAAPTVAELVARYQNDGMAALKPRTVRLYGEYFRNHVVPAIGRKRAVEVTYSDIAKLHRSIGAKGAKVTANRVVALIGGFYVWAGKAGEVPRGTNPALDVDRFREQARTRYLSDDEIGRLGETLTLAETVGLPYMNREASPARIAKIVALAEDERGDAAIRTIAREKLVELRSGKGSKHSPGPNARHIVSPHATNAIRLLLLSGCRLSEILNLRWSDVDVTRGLLLLQDSKTGPRPVWLSAAALAVIESLSTIKAGDYVIAGDRPDRPRADLNKPWRQIVKHAGLVDVTLHTLRHTNASVGVGANIGIPLVGALLGHKVARTTQRYAHLADAPVRAAAETIGSAITAALERRRP